MTSSGDTLELSLGSEYLDLIARGIVDVKNGEGDHCIGDGDDVLWFWWMG